MQLLRESLVLGSTSTYIDPIIQGLNGGVHFESMGGLGVTYEGDNFLPSFSASYEGFRLPPAGLGGDIERVIVTI